MSLFDRLKGARNRITLAPETRWHEPATTADQAFAHRRVDVSLGQGAYRPRTVRHAACGRYLRRRPRQQPGASHRMTNPPQRIDSVASGLPSAAQSPTAARPRQGRLRRRGRDGARATPGPGRPAEQGGR
jgi:hypothetical protein